MELSKQRKPVIMLKGMMIGFILILATSLNTFSQTLGEFFNQRKTQTRYLFEQVAALEMYGSYLKKGYQIAATGLQTVTDFSNGEFNLHKTFINSLKAVSPVVRNNQKIAEIIEMQMMIGKAFNHIIAMHDLPISHKIYIGNVRGNLWEESLKDLEDLLLLVTSGKLEMSDDERIKRLDNIYLSMREKTAFTQYFTTQINLYANSKELDRKLIEQLKKSYEIQE